MNTIIWVDGEFYDEGEPAVSALDRGLLLGYGVFETLVVENGVPFALTRHLKRLENSARIIGLALPERGRLREAMSDVLNRWNDQADQSDRGRLRLTVTGGVGPLGLPSGEAKPSVIVTLAAAGPARKLGSSQGISAIVSPWRVNPNAPLTGAKTLSYASNAVEQAYASERGVGELISATVDGQVCEGAISNVFVEVGGELLTPPLSAGCLPGITRELILEWADDAGLPVRVAERAELPIEILDSAPHIAVTGSVRGIMPVTRMGQRELEPGPITEAVAELFAQKSARVVDP